MLYIACRLFRNYVLCTAVLPSVEGFEVSTTTTSTITVTWEPVTGLDFDSYMIIYTDNTNAVSNTVRDISPSVTSQVFTGMNFLL